MNSEGPFTKCDTITKGRKHGRYSYSLPCTISLDDVVVSFREDTLHAPPT